MPTITVDGLTHDLDQPIQELQSSRIANVILEAAGVIAGEVFPNAGSRRNAFFTSDGLFLRTSCANSVQYRPDHFHHPLLNSEGSVKSGIRYRDGMMVSVSKQSAAWGNVKTEESYVGYIRSVDEDTLVVIPLAAIRSQQYWRGPVMHVGGRGYTIETSNQIFGQERVVSKRSATILNPAKVTLRTYAEMAIHARLKRVDSSLTKLKNNLSLDKDPRYAKAKLFLANDASLRSWYGANKRKIRKADGKFRAYVWACFRANNLKDINDYRLSRTDEVVRAVWERHSGGLNSRDFTNIGRQINAMITQWNDKYPAERLLDTSCGHLSFDTVETIDNDMYLSHVCPNCAVGLTTIQHDGRTIHVAGHATLYEQDDGTMGVRKPRPIIGSYHSSKAYVGLLQRPPQMVHVAPSGLTIGIELEMEVVRIQSDSHREGIARKVLARIKAAHNEGVKISSSSKQYAFFERDGSVEQGFEMVTGWGELSTHEYYIKRVFGVVDGETKLPFSGLLRSHDAQASCGLHVHMAKPESLIHATKLQSFYNAEENKLLIRTIARRYDTNFTKVAQGKEKEKVSANAKHALQRTGYVLSRCDSTDAKYAVAASIKKLTESRYDSVNFLPEKTVEIRIFKGSMLPTTIMACIEFAHATWFFCRDVPADALTSDNFLSYIADEKRRHETANLRTYLAARGYKTYQPKYHAGQAKVEHDFNSADA